MVELLQVLVISMVFLHIYIKSMKKLYKLIFTLIN